jgi:synaptosomal-associated protein 29
MSGHNYLQNGSLFSDDVDDDTFLKNSRVKPRDDYLQERQIYEQRRREIEDRTLDSSQRSIGLLRETEQVGIATATELSKQREQLEKTRNTLDTINTSLKFSQRHLNGIKSMFGGLKNYLGGKSDAEAKISPSSSNSEVASLPSPSIEDRYSNHPTTRLRGGHMQQQQMSPQSGTFNHQLDRNLDDMCDSLSRLKGLAIDLNSEIETQNDLIDDIHNKVEDTDMKINRQNREMFKILGKK